MSTSLFGLGTSVTVNAAGTIIPQSYIGLSGQTLFLITNFAYAPGTNSILVFINGQKQTSGKDYQETSANSFTLLEGVVLGDNVDVIGFPVLTLTANQATAVSWTQQGTGAVVRNVATKLYENISPYDFGAVGNSGGTDDTAAFQLAVNAGTATNLVLDLGGGSFNITTVNIPNAKAVRIQNGAINVIGADSAGFSKITTVSPQSGGAFAKYDLTVDNVQFSRSVTGGSCIYMLLAWQDATAGIITSPSCSFALTNGAVGIRASRSFGGHIEGRFNMDATSTGFLCDSTTPFPADAAPSCPFLYTFGHAWFTGGIGFDQAYQSASTWNAFEGFTFTSSCTFYASLFRAKKYDTLKLIGATLVSAKAVFDGGNDTTIIGGYADRQAGEGTILTFQTTIRSCLQGYIGGGFQLNAQLTGGDLMTFDDTGTAAGATITNFVVDGTLFIAGVNDAGNKVAGIKCNHANMRNLNIGGANSFENMYSCISFTKGINRSIIHAFDARDITWYVENVATGYGTLQYNRFDPVYRVLDQVDLIIPTYINSGVSEVIFEQVVSFDSMMRPPVASVSNQLNPFGANFSIAVGFTYRNCIMLQLVKAIAAPGGARAGQSATVTLDASQYIAPL